MGQRFQMPNTPRDPDEEERRRLIMKKRLEQDRDAYGRGAQQPASLPPQESQGMGDELMEIIGNIITGGSGGPGGGAPSAPAPNPTANSQMNLMHAKPLIEPRAPDRAIPPFKSFPIGEKPEDVLSDRNFPFPSMGPQPSDRNSAQPSMGGGLTPEARMKVQERLRQMRGAPAPAQGMPNKLPSGPQSRQVNLSDAPPMAREQDKFPEFVGGQDGFQETPVGQTSNLPSENPGTETLVPPVDGDFRGQQSSPVAAPPPNAGDEREAKAREYLEQSLINPKEPSSLPYGDLLMRSAAQVGTLGGKHADTQPFTDFTKNMMAQESGDEDRRMKIAEYLAKKNQAKSGALKDDTFNREKLAAEERRWNADRTQKEQQYQNESKKLAIMHQNMLNQAKSQEEANRINADYRKSAGALNEARANALEGSGGLRKKELELKEKDLGLKERDLKLKEKTPPKAARSPGQDAADRTVGKEYAEFQALGGGAKVRQNINRLKRLSESLKTADVSGPYRSLSPDWVTAATNPKQIEIRDEIQSIIQESTKALLGSQFTEREGENMLKRGYNEKLSEAENKRRVDNVLAELEQRLAEKESAFKYYESSGGTMGGYQAGQQKSPTGSVAPNIDGSRAGSKPKTVIQNGHTYTLNPETGEYE